MDIPMFLRPIVTKVWIILPGLQMLKVRIVPLSCCSIFLIHNNEVLFLLPAKILLFFGLSVIPYCKIALHFIFAEIEGGEK